MADAKLTIYPSEELKARLMAIAVNERRSLNAQVCIALEQYADTVEGRTPFQPLRSIAVDGDRHVDMVTGREVDPVTLEPVVGPAPLPQPRRRRTQPCEHRIGPDQFCKVCDV